MAKFGVSWGDFATTTAVITMIKLVSVTKAPVEIVEAAMYGGGTTAPADVQHAATLARVSAAGAGTGTASPPTPEPFGNTLAAASSTILWKMTAEPTTYATVFPVLSALTNAVECVGAYPAVRACGINSRIPRCIPGGGVNRA